MVDVERLVQSRENVTAQNSSPRSEASCEKICAGGNLKEGTLLGICFGTCTFNEGKEQGQAVSEAQGTEWRHRDKQPQDPDICVASGRTQEAARQTILDHCTNKEPASAISKHSL